MRKFISIWLIFSLVYSSFLPVSLLATPTYQERAKTRVQSSMDRAERLNDETAWTNYVLLGIATEFTAWENEAVEEMRKEVRTIEGATLTREEKDARIATLETELDADRVQWEQDAEDHLLSERGKFLAEKADLSATEVAESVYDAMIVEAEASVAAIADLDLTTWESALATAHAGLVATFETDLDAKLTTARATAITDPAERASFEAQLNAIAESIRREFEIRDSFFLTRAKNKYIQVKRADDVSAKLASDQQSAEQITNALIEDTQLEANSGVTDAIAMPDATSGPESVELFGKKVEDSVQAGLLLWQKAEEDLYAKRLTWMEEYKKSRADAEKVWAANHAKLKDARAAWTKEVQLQIAEGRRQYEEKSREFADSRDAALAELSTFVDGELSRRNEISARTGDIIRGGGAALAQAKDAYNYYNDLVSRLGAPVRADYGTRQADYDRDLALYNFYVTQRGLMAAAITSFGNSLTSSEGVLQDVLHSDSNSSGLLLDKRVFAGDLPIEIEALSAGNFRSELEGLIASRAADLPLYARDLVGLIQANSSAVQRIIQVRDGTSALFSGATDKTGLLNIAATIAQGQERSEILTILQKTRSGTEAEQLAAMKAEILHYFEVGTNEDARLRAATLSYFQSAGQGAYAVDNENDPYLMTQAEYDWELLRRDRAALARRLRRAEEVKRYADLAKSHQAGLEMASITEERAEMSRIHSELAEVLYLAAKGDLAFAAAAKTDSVVLESELNRILGARGVNTAALTAKGAVLDSAIDFTQRLSAMTRPTGADLTALIADAEAIASSSKVVASLRDRLLEMRDGAAQDAASLDTRWNGIVSASGVSRDELMRLKSDYRLDEAADVMNRIRTAMQSRTTAELAGDLAARRTDLEASAQALAALKLALDEKKNVYQAAYIDFQTIASGSAEDLIRIEITDALSRLGSVIHGMHTIQGMPGMAGMLTQSEKEAAGAVLEAGQAESSGKGLSDVSSGLDEFSALRASKARTEILTTITPVFASRTGRAAADEILTRKAQLLPSGEDAAGAALRNAILNLEASRGELTALETRIASATADEKPALELLRDSLELKLGHAARALLEIAKEEDTARLRLFNSWLSQTASPVDAAAVKTAEEAALARAERIDSDAIGIAENLLRTNQGKTSAEIAAIARALVAAAPADPNPGNQTAQDDRMKAARAADLILGVLSSVDEANKNPTTADSRTKSEKWRELIAALSQSKTSADVRTAVYSAVPTAMTDAPVVAILNRQAALKVAVEAILAGVPGTEYAAFTALSAADRAELSQYGAVRLDTPRSSMEAIIKALDTELALTDPRTIYLHSVVRQKAIELGPQLRLQAEKAVVVQELTASAKDRQDRITALEADLAAETDPVVQADLQNQIDALTAELGLIGARLDTLRPELEAIDAVVNEIYAGWSEAQQRGSSSPDLAGLFEMMRGTSAKLQLMSLERKTEDPAKKARELLNTAAGVDLSTWAVGNRSAREVTEMADKVLLWMKKEENTGNLAAPVKLAIEQLASDLRRAALARERIAKRDADPATLKAEANGTLEAVSKREKALMELDALEGNLANLLATGGALTGLKFASLDLAGFAGDAALETRAREILTKLNTYAKQVDKRALVIAAGTYNQRLLDRAATGTVDYAADKTASLAPVKAGALVGIINGIAADADFKKNLIEGSSAIDAGIRGEIITAALLSVNTGAALKAEILALAQARDAERLAEFAALSGEAEKNAAATAARVYAENKADFTAAVNEFAATLTDPTIAAAVLEKANRGRIVDSLLLAEAGGEYVAADYPAEVRELVLSRAMAKVEGRFAQNAADPESPVDLSGVPDQFVEYAIARRLTDRAATLATYLSENPGGTAKGWAQRELYDFAGIGASALTFAEEYAAKIAAGTAAAANTYLPGGAVPRAYSEVKAEAQYAFLAGVLDGEQGINDVSLLMKEATKLGETDEAEKEFAIIEKDRTDASTALSGVLEAHVKTSAAERERIAGERTIAQGMLKFADELLVPLEQRRILNDRTFPGSASSYMEAQYAEYEAETIAAGGTPVSKEEFFATSQTGTTVVPGTEGQSAGSVLAGDFENNLKTDPFASHQITVGGNTIDIRTRYQISPDTSGTAEQVLKEIFYASLGNDYIEAASDVERSLQRLASAAGLADDTVNEVATLKTTIDGLATDAEKEAAILARKQALQAEVADHSEAKVQEKLSNAQSAIAERENASQEYAEAARRQLLRALGATQFIQNVFQTASNELAQAQADFDSAAQALNAERQVYMDQNTLYTQALNNTSRAYNSFVEKREVYETAMQVKEYANTPYLYSSSAAADDSLNTLSQDANDEYERARAMYAQVQTAMEDQSIAVAAQDRLSEFSILADKIAAGQSFTALSPTDRTRLAELQKRDAMPHNEYGDSVALTAAEQLELASLREREIYEVWGATIEKRAEHISHSLRMIRLEKAAALIQSEVARREAVATEAKARFERALETNFGMSNLSSDPAKRDEQIAARNAVYKRLANLDEATNGAGFYNEYKSWFWGGSGWFEAYGGATTGTYLSGQPQNVQITPTQQLEALTGMMGAAAIADPDKQAIGTWMGAGGSLAEFSGFAGVYYSFLASTGLRDMKLAENMITKGIYVPLMQASMMQFAYAQSLATAAAALGPFGIGMQAVAAGIRTAAVAQYRLSQQMLMRAEAQFLFAQSAMFVMQIAAVASARNDSVRAVREKEIAYEEAQAGVDYFTKIPDLQTLKTRLKEWGAQHSDDDSANNLYDVTDDDLRYLFDVQGGVDTYVNADGSTTTISDEDKADAINLTSKTQTESFRDSLGRRYDPATLTSAVPGPLVGGVYQGGDGNYTRVRTMQHNGSTIFQYAKIIDMNAASADTASNTRKVYNLSEISRLVTEHGNNLLAEKKAEYIAAGDAAAAQRGDTGFLLAERDATFSSLFEAARSQDMGGREFAGYTNTFADYEANTARIGSTEIQQRAAVQQREWQIREQELADKRAAWEDKVQSILKRGQEQFAANEDRYLMEWRNWSREQDQRKAAAEKEWKDKIDATLAAKVNWKKDAQNTLTIEGVTKTMQETLSALNGQLAAIGVNTGIKTNPVNITAAINETIAQIKLAEPKSERLKEINNEIATFNTRISLSEMTQQKAGALESVEKAFSALMTEHSREMTVLANVKTHEQYRTMIDGFLEQYEDQNQKIEMQTASAAGSAGYVRAGGIYVKPGNQTAGVVHAYTFFDTKAAINEALEATGFSEMTGDVLVDFLKNKSDVEVGSYFKMQQTALTLAFEKVAGKGSGAERETSRDERVIGKFGKWAGKQQDSSTANQLVTHGGPGADPVKAQQAGDFLSFIALAGFGELGETAMRPSQIGPGFYVELELMNRVYGMEMGRQQMKGMGSLDPISTMVNQYNPVAMMAQSTQNVRMAVLTQGKSEGYMWEAQAINMLKAPIVMTGSAMMMFAPSVGPLAPLLFAAGAVVSAAGNSISVNPTTGERAMKMTDQAAVNTGVSVLTSFIGGSAAFEGLSKAAQTGFSLAQSVTVAAAQSAMRYDSEGRSQGMSFKSRHGDMHGENVLISAAVAGAVGGLGSVGGEVYGGNSNLSQAVFGDVLSTGANVLTEYTKQQTWGKDKSNYEALTKPDAGRLGALAGSMGLAANKDRYQNNAMAEAQKAANEGRKGEAIKILAGAGFARDQREKMALQMEARAAFEARNLKDTDEGAMTIRGAFSGHLKDGGEGAKLLTEIALELQAIVKEKGGYSAADMERIARDKGLTGDINWGAASQNGVELRQLGMRNQLQGFLNGQGNSLPAYMTKQMGLQPNSYYVLGDGVAVQTDNAGNATRVNIHLARHGGPAAEEFQGGMNSGESGAGGDYENNPAPGFWDDPWGSVKKHAVDQWNNARDTAVRGWDKRGEWATWGGFAAGAADWYLKNIMGAGVFSWTAPSVSKTVSDVTGVGQVTGKDGKQYYDPKSAFFTGASIGEVAPDAVAAMVALPQMARGLVKGGISLATSEGRTALRAAMRAFQQEAKLSVQESFQQLRGLIAKEAAQAEKVVAGQMASGGLGSTKNFAEVRQFLRDARLDRADLRTLRTDGPWELDRFARGRFFDEYVGNNLGQNFPKIDNMEWAQGIARGTKSLDPRLATYSNATPGSRTGMTAFERQLTRYFDTLRDYGGGSWNNINIDPALIRGKPRILDLVVPQKSLQPWQEQVLRRLAKNYANPSVAGTPPVELNIISLF